MTKDIFTGKICPYCLKGTEFVESSIIYGKNYGMIYLCKSCDAYVGVHKGTNKSLGRLANAELRKWKILAHKYFDKLYKSSNRFNSRKEAYQWLSKIMQVDKEYAHIAMFDVKQCKKLISLCEKLTSSF